MTLAGVEDNVDHCNETVQEANEFTGESRSRVPVIRQALQTTNEKLKQASCYTPVVGVVSKGIAVGSGGYRFDFCPVKSGTVSQTARHRFYVSSEMCFPVARPWSKAPPLGTRFRVTTRL